MSLLPLTKNTGNGFAVVRVHYLAHPEKRKPEWIIQAQANMPKDKQGKAYAWQREYEIDYSSFAGKSYFPEFTELNISKIKIEYKQNEILYRAWDFGFHRPCVLITKLDEFDRWCWLKVILGQDEGIMDFGKRVRMFCLSEYPGAKWVDACDIAGIQVSDKSEKTSVDILNMLGIYPQSRKQPIKQGSEIIRQKLHMRADGKVGLLVDQSQEDIISGFKGGLHYPEAKEGKSEKEFYLKDGYYDHIFDAARYLATEMFTVIGQTQQENEITKDASQTKYAMGSPYTSSDVNSYDQDDGLGGFF